MSMSELSFTMENYLEAIYELSKKTGCARLTDIAERMNVTKASANSAISTLSSKDLVIYEPYKEVSLTPKGMVFAKNTSQKHQIVKKFFSSVLNIDSKTADEDACAIEHVISCESINAMLKFMGKSEQACFD
jgi:DtxR family transcriptional regulator, Mn-dependent transcriptional regulator